MSGAAEARRRELWGIEWREDLAIEVAAWLLLISGWVTYADFASFSDGVANELVSAASWNLGLLASLLPVLSVLVASHRTTGVSRALRFAARATVVVGGVAALGFLVWLPFLARRDAYDGKDVVAALVSLLTDVCLLVGSVAIVFNDGLPKPVGREAGPQ